MHFVKSLQHAWQLNNSLVCVGLDPGTRTLPGDIA